MPKAVLVMDMPESCDKCPCFCDYYSDMNCRINHRTINYPYPKDFRQRWCPLKELPEKEEYNDRGFGTNMFKAGFNACLAKISKGGGLA